MSQITLPLLIIHMAHTTPGNKLTIVLCQIYSFTKYATFLSFTLAIGISWFYYMLYPLPMEMHAFRQRDFFYFGK